MQPNDQNPEQPQQPQPPQPLQPSTQGQQPTAASSMTRTIHPLSSEDSIRSQVEAASPRPQPQDNTKGSSHVDENVKPTNDYYAAGNLITEPIQRPQNAVDQNSVPLPTKEVPVQKRSKKLPIAILGIALIAVVAAAYFFLFAGRVGAADLIRETDGSSTYLRPKQWQSLTVFTLQGISSYGDTGKDADKLKLTSAVLFKEAPSIPQLADTSDDMIDRLRQELLSQASTGQLNLGMSGPMSCDSRSDPKIEADTKKNSTTTGLIISSSTCESNGKKVTTKLRVVIGKDGTGRMITVMARDESWLKNEKVFQSMLESVEQAS